MASLNLEGGEEEGVLLPIDLELQSSTHEYYSVGGFFYDECSLFFGDEKPNGKSVASPKGFFSEAVAKQLGNFVWIFMEYDTKLINRGLKNHLQIRVK
ncbi:hypothetical protein Gogos_018298, partial [Gossypium gossypioides]|nr:hypothetical protein [Gossypium gossypioides]